MRSTLGFVTHVKVEHNDIEMYREELGSQSGVPGDGELTRVSLGTDAWHEAKGKKKTELELIRLHGDKVNSGESLVIRDKEQKKQKQRTQTGKMLDLYVSTTVSTVNTEYLISQLKG